MNPPRLPKILLSLSLLFITLSTSLTYADGLSDLQSALKSFKQSSAFKAQVNASLKSGNADDKENPVKEGHTQFTLEKSQTGLQISYPNEILEAVAEETELRKQNPQAPTPATDAINRFKYSEFSILFDPVRDLEDDLRKAKLVKEEQVTFQNQPARLLHMQIPLEKLSEGERKDLKKYNADIQIWINEQGIPPASRSIGKGSGRFALVIGFEFHFEVDKTYLVNGDRLLVTRLTSTSGSSGGGMNNNETINASLALLN